MTSCQHLFADPRHACPHSAPGEATLCIWHNVAVTKDDPYVRALFLHADALHAGSGPAGGAFIEAHLAGLDLKDLRLPGRDFTGADLRDANFDGCDLTAAIFANANLRRVSLRRADLRGADLRGTNLTGTSFLGADLREANLAGAVLDGTVLLGADLRGANLEGAQVADFQWNRLTRFQGVRGLEPKFDQADGETTQIFLAPIALEDLDAAERLALDRDPDLARTRVFSLGRSSSAEFSSPSAPVLSVASSRLRLSWVLIPALAALIAGAAVGGGTMALSRPQALPSVDQDELAGLRTQHEADLGQLKELQERASTTANELSNLQQTAHADAARVVVMRQQLEEAQAELAHLHDADDRAMTAALANKELDLLNRDLAGATAKQERLAKILAEGVARFRGESEHLASELAESKTRAAALESTQADNIRLSKKVSVLTQERDALNDLYQRTHGDLVAAHGDIERYLARISGTQLQGLLAEDANAAALIPLTLGQPVSMGGDFLVTLTVSQPPTGKTTANAPATVMIKLVVQRPAAAANPDATVVLYDAKRRPLRRIATSFPHVDQGAPFVTLGASLTCDRTPAFARIILAPGLDHVAAK
jgi:hypothetical protein